MTRASRSLERALVGVLRRAPWARARAQALLMGTVEKPRVLAPSGLECIGTTPNSCKIRSGNVRDTYSVNRS